MKDAYYISVLASIAEHPNRIRNMFMTNKINREGIFGVRIYKNGEETLVTIDNLFPCKSRKPCFSRATSNELWPLILEKVWAKLHGCYEEIIEGQCYEVFHTLLGAPSYYCKTNESHVWKMLLNGYKKNYIQSASANPPE